MDYRVKGKLKDLGIYGAEVGISTVAGFRLAGPYGALGGVITGAVLAIITKRKRQNSYSF